MVNGSGSASEPHVHWPLRDAPPSKGLIYNLPWGPTLWFQEEMESEMHSGISPDPLIAMDLE